MQLYIFGWKKKKKKRGIGTELVLVRGTQKIHSAQPGNGGVEEIMDTAYNELAVYVSVTECLSERQLPSARV